MDNNEKPILTHKDIENRKIMMILELGMKELLALRRQYKSENQIALATKNVFVLAVQQDKFVKLETDFLDLAKRLENLTFEIFELEAELILASTRCRLEKLETQLQRMEFYNSMEIKIARHKDRNPIIQFDRISFETVIDEIRRLRVSLDDNL